MLELADLMHRFGDNVAVDGVNLSVPDGSIVGLVGRNGAGKTTTMRAIMGILRPLRGTVSWNGHPVTPDDRRTFGYMPEERGLYPHMKVIDQVRYFARLHGLSTEEAQRSAVGLLDRLGLAGRATDKLMALSHGNQQRAQLAVALVHGPRLMVLDEPFAGLDPAAVDSLSGVITDRAAEGVGVLFSSHQLELVERLCRHVVIVEKGKVLASGTLDDLRRRVPQHLRIDVAAPPDWAEALSGVHIQQVTGESIALLLDPGVDPQTVLKEAMAAGRVDHFGFESAGLADLYRTLVPE
ncbi:MAG TPA: ATP-binding cassette domain-containing protein [Actinomycetota bacterium]|nr:ATP-binding cassette domain-containing protein [Actinomycetota bacterium]